MNDKLQTETIRINPRRVFKCKQENKIATRQDVLKMGDTYRCKSCGGAVEDVTNTETGQSFMQVLAI